MIIDLQKFSATERPAWQELEKLLDRIEGDPVFKLNLNQARRFHYLYERASADLARLVTFSSEPELRRYLESLVARAYTEIHETRSDRKRFSPWHWFLHTLPQTFRRHARAFWLSLTELKPQSMRIHDAQAEKTFAHGLAAPHPFQGDRVTDGNREIEEDAECRCQIRRDHGKERHRDVEGNDHHGAADEIEDPREESHDRSGQAL